jgi:hypothetical protein
VVLNRGQPNSFPALSAWFQSVDSGQLPAVSSVGIEAGILLPNSDAVTDWQNHDLNMDIDQLAQDGLDVGGPSDATARRKVQADIKQFEADFARDERDADLVAQGKPTPAGSSTPVASSTTPTTNTPAASTATRAQTATSPGSYPCPLETNASGGQCVPDSYQTVYSMNGGQSRFFDSPSGNISCELDFGLATVPDGANCETATPPQTVSLTDTGQVSSCMRANCDLGNGSEDEYPLQYGNETQFGPFTCASDASAGITCTADGGGGFSINRSGITQITAVQCGTYTVANTRSEVLAQQISCPQAVSILDAFRSAEAVEHKGQAMVTTYWTLTAYPGWRCGVGAGGGACSYGATEARYNFETG